MTAANRGYTLYGARGWGSALVEGFFALADIYFSFEDVNGFDQPGEARDRLTAINPLAQVPTLILPDGTVMTESAAIALLLSERHPHSQIAPAPSDPRRPMFLRRLIWIVANIYPTFTYYDYPLRWVASEPDLFQERVLDYRKALWLEFEKAIHRGSTGVLGDQISALDVYVAVMTRWRPGLAWFRQHCPVLSSIGQRAVESPVLGSVLSRNFPDSGQ